MDLAEAAEDEEALAVVDDVEEAAAVDDEAADDCALADAETVTVSSVSDCGAVRSDDEVVGFAWACTVAQPAVAVGEAIVETAFICIFPLIPKYPQRLSAAITSSFRPVCLNFEKIHAHAHSLPMESTDKACCTFSTTDCQSPIFGWRKRCMVGYQGQSSRSRSQRQSGMNGTSTQTGTPSAPAKCAV